MVGQLLNFLMASLSSGSASTLRLWKSTSATLRRQLEMGQGVSWITAQPQPCRTAARKHFRAHSKAVRHCENCMSNTQHITAHRMR